MNSQRKQQGATLVTALVMLVVLTLLVISAIRSSTVNLRIAGNMQIQEEGITAAQQGIEQIISNDFTGNPIASSINIDIDKNGTNDYIANVTKPTCNGGKILLSNDPDIASPAFNGCRGGDTYDPTMPVKMTNCAKQQWEVQSTAQDANAGATGTSATVHQGVTLIVLSDTTC